MPSRLLNTLAAAASLLAPISAFASSNKPSPTPAEPKKKTSIVSPSDYLPRNGGSGMKLKKHNDVSKDSDCLKPASASPALAKPTKPENPVAPKNESMQLKLGVSSNPTLSQTGNGLFSINAGYLVGTFHLEPKARKSDPQSSSKGEPSQLPGTAQKRHRKKASPNIHKRRAGQSPVSGIGAEGKTALAPGLVRLTVTDRTLLGPR